MRTTYLFIFILFFPFVAMIFSSCTVLYAPMTPNVPLMEGRNELQAEAGIATDGASFKTAYSPVNHLAIQINGQSGFVHGSRREISGAIGTYFVLADIVHMELYGGYSYATVNFSQSAPDDAYNPLTSATGYYHKPFGQFDIGFSSKTKAFYGGFCIRASYIDFYYTDAVNRRESYLAGTHDYSWICDPYAFINIRLYKQLSMSLYAGVTLAQHDIMMKDYFVMGTGLRVTLFQKGKALSRVKKKPLTQKTIITKENVK
jgi:hypothetical protein